MGRVEETNEVTRAIEEGTISNFKKAYWAKTSNEMSGAIQIEIAKSLAQLTDDIHFLREILAKELENDEVPSARRRQTGAKCMDCRYCEFARKVDWCRRKGIEIDGADRPVCGYFEYRGKEAES